MIACKYGKIDIIKYVFGRGNFDINAVDALGNTALFYSFTSSSENNLKLVKFLIAMGSRSFSNYSWKIWPPHLACLGNLYDVAKYLLTKSAFNHIDLKRVQPAQYGLIQSALGYGSWKYAENSGIFFEKVQISMKTNLKGEVAFSFTKECSSETLSFYYPKGADVNSIDSREWIVYKVLWNQEMSQQLTKESCNWFNQPWNQFKLAKWTGQHCNALLCETFHIDVIELLLGAGARTDIPNNEGRFPFDCAVICDPFSLIVKSFEMRLNYSEDIPQGVKSQSYDHCNCRYSSLIVRCGHYLHELLEWTKMLSCLWFESFCLKFS